jgi:hypothetical protein
MHSPEPSRDKTASSKKVSFILFSLSFEIQMTTTATTNKKNVTPFILYVFCDSYLEIG